MTRGERSPGHQAGNESPGPARKYSFASDNSSGADELVLRALTNANDGHAAAYGDDEYTARAEALFRSAFGDGAEIFLVYTGTAANVIGLGAVCRPYDAIICSESSHLAEDECGAPLRFIGCALREIPHAHGKVDISGLQSTLLNPRGEHRNRPRVVSISEATELGTVYDATEIRTIADWAHDHGMYLHMDGARLANAAATLDCSLAALTTDAGVDLLSFGGTKNGLLGAEAIVVLGGMAVGGMAVDGMAGGAMPRDDLRYVRKQALHLGSKMRFLAAQFIAYLENDRWRVLARHANAMADRLAAAAGRLDGVQISHPVQANAVFAILPTDTTRALQQRHTFHLWDERTDEVRWMTSFDTPPEAVDEFVRDLADCLASS